MTDRPSRKTQWLSKTAQIVVSGSSEPVRVTIEGPRPFLAETKHPQGALILAWAIAGGLSSTAHPTSAVRRRGREVSIRLDRLPSQIRTRLTNELPLTTERRQDIWSKALELGTSDDLDAQKRALALFRAEPLAGIFPALRVVLTTTTSPPWGQRLTPIPCSLLSRSICS
jgi:hypothetical protein